MTLQRVGEHSEQMEKRVPLGEFLKDWSKADRRKELKAHPGWPHNRTVVTSQARAMFAKGAIFTAIGAATYNIEKHFPTTDKIESWATPQKKVLAAVTLEPGDLVLAPDTTKVKAVKKTDDMPDLPEAVLRPNDTDYRFFLASSSDEQDLSPLWCISTTEQEDEANMVWQKVLVTTNCGVDFVGLVKVPPAPCPGAKAKSRVRGGGSPQDFTEATSQVVMLPILVNKVRLRVGQQLLVFKKAATKRAREAREITIAQLAKKPKGA